MRGREERGEPGRMPPGELVDVLGRHLVAQRDQVGDRPRLLVGGNADRGRGIREDHVEIDQEAAPIALGERGREVRGHERRAGTPRAA